MKLVQSGNDTKLNFSLSGYQEMLQRFIDADYEFVNYETVKSNCKHVINRHDIDFSIDYALQISKIEKKLEIKSIYFLLIRSEFYNIFSKKSIDLIAEILENGHDIGLHFDMSLYGNDISNIDDYVANECQILTNLTGKEVNVVSFHRPIDTLLGMSDNVGGKIHTYQPRFFDDIGYCSDSRGEWKYGNPFQHDSFSNSLAIQLLTHPIWWLLNQGSPKNKLDFFLTERFNFLKQEIRSNSSVY